MRVSRLIGITPWYRPEAMRHLHVHVNMNDPRVDEALARLEDLREGIMELASASGASFNQVQQRLNAIEGIMSALSDAVAGVKSRLDEDWAEAQRQIQELSNLVDQAAALDVTQEAEIADLKSQRDAILSDFQTAQQDASAAVEELNAIDVDPSFPAQPEPEPEPEPEPPVEDPNA